MRGSVRIRLTLWYTAVLAFVLCAFSAGIYLLQSRSVYDRLDGRLRAAVEIVTLSLNHEIEEHHGAAAGEDSLRSVLHTMYANSFRDRGVAVFDAGGTMIASKPSTDGAVPWLPGGIQYATPRMRFVDSGAQRIAVAPVTVAFTGGHYFVAAIASLEPVRAALAEFRKILFAAVPVTLIVAALGGYFLARRSLAQVATITNTVEQITSQSLGRRVEVANAEDELGHLAETFNRLLERLDASFEQQRRFMADASHELRTPISVAQTAAQVALEPHPRTEQDYRDALSIIESQLRRLGRVVQQMLMLARADAGAFSIRKANFYLDELLAEAARAVRVLAARKGVALEAAPMTEAPCCADQALVRQVVEILLDNAVKYTPSGGKVTLALEQRPQAYAVSVTDTGIGIPPEEQNLIFRRFYRVDKARSRAEADESGGAGLGLAIARWIAEAHGGSLTLTRSGSTGSAFTFILPNEERPYTLAS
jgi:heavy metal sensor kinase